MPGQPTQAEIDKLQSELAKAIDKINKLQKQLEKEPRSDGKQSVAGIIAAKLSMLAGFQKMLTPAGALTLTPDELADLRKKIKKNVGPKGGGIGALIVALFKTLVGIIKDILEGVWDILVECAKAIPAVFEESDGDADVEEVDSRTFKLRGRTDNLRMTFNTPLQQLGFPARGGPYAGSWEATLSFHGTDENESSRYLVTSYLYSAASLVTVGPSTLRGLRQVLDVEEDSVFTVTKEGDVSGVLYTRFLSENWPNDELGVPAISTVTGMLVGKRLFYHCSGEDFCWVASLLPNVAQSVLEGRQGTAVRDLRPTSIGIESFRPPLRETEKSPKT